MNEQGSVRAPFLEQWWGSPRAPAPPRAACDRGDSRRDYVKGVLDDALVIVAELGVPKDLAPVALAKAIDLLASAEG